MEPTVVIVGRPNVGKSTLFNRLTRSRDAIVADAPGITRDRHYGRGRVGNKGYLVVDTGGFEPVAKDGIMHEMARQTRQAVDEADIILFIVDARAGLTAQDEIVADELRRSGRKVHLVVNKAEGMDPAAAAAEFHALGMGDPLSISAAHGENVTDLMSLVLADFPEAPPRDEEKAERPRIAIVGRPNVGKSTLVNALLGEERVIVFDRPGTTRDSIYIDFTLAGRDYTLIDTAGVRKRGKVDEVAEKYSVIKTLQAISDANVAVLVLDATQDISEQDAHIAGFILEAGRALVVAINKWDGLSDYERDMAKRSLARKLSFLSFARLHFVSAREGHGLKTLMKSVDAAYAAAMSHLATPRLTRVLQSAVQQQQPPRAGLVRPKLRYAHQGGV
ncbi:MAG TPA: ribosome biogenesis GTPase Der, partial [Burkholderiales bacterium]|nr:ribosome biogenesis GTPase Der [Burkholderiales bacterium]